jgi:hypothetical protein
VGYTVHMTTNIRLFNQHILFIKALHQVLNIIYYLLKIAGLWMDICKELELGCHLKFHKALKLQAY